jgi:hypothetical protein
MTHIWHDLLFLHWPIHPNALREVVPRALDIDAWDAVAWLAVVPFWMSGIRLRRLPAMPGASGFAELNVRTYVRYRGRPGVYFMSLDGHHRILPYIARRWYHLPYLTAHISQSRKAGGIEFECNRTDRSAPSARLRAHYRPIGARFEPRPGSLEAWLVERYRLYTTDRFGRIWRADIHHRPWALQNAEASIESNTMPRAHGLCVPHEPALSHYAERMEVLVWSPELQSPIEPGEAPPRCGSGKSRYRAERKSVTIE